MTFHTFFNLLTTRDLSNNLKLWFHLCAFVRLQCYKNNYEIVVLENKWMNVLYGLYFILIQNSGSKVIRILPSFNCYNKLTYYFVQFETSPAYVDS